MLCKEPTPHIMGLAVRPGQMIWTGNEDRARLECSTGWVNQYNNFDLSVPFAGATWELPISDAREGWAATVKFS
jgi:hypothetical protein